ncbi:glycosyltransferase [Pseudotamlana agarivorans]|uniref:glycosyltransferase n=1 Tax=Pseudotamlana agarivorans TaxID=481183 RepID=UPI0008364726|nr:glycosyltransferase [Tamlana agarivorans]
MKKIVILTDQISEIGGITSLIHSKANYWVEKRDYQIDIITTEQKNKPPFYELNEKVNLHDIAINYNRHASYFGPKNFLKIIGNVIKLQKLIWSIKPDLIIIANHIPVSFFFPILITKSKFAKEFHFSKYQLSKRKKNFSQKFQHVLESKFDFLIVLSPEERTFYNNENVVVIPNPIEVNKEKAIKFQGRKKIAMAAGRLSEVKRFDTLIDIWSAFVKDNNDWILEIYGNGEKNYVEVLNKKILDLGITNSVKIKPSTNAIKTKMRENGMYLMTSEAECFPMVLLEALSCGLPILSFDCPTGPRNIISNMLNGILVEDKNNEAFVKKLHELADNENLRVKLAENGYNTVENYDMEKIMHIWDKEVINKI